MRLYMDLNEYKVRRSLRRKPKEDASTSPTQPTFKQHPVIDLVKVFKSKVLEGVSSSSTTTIYSRVNRRRELIRGGK